jgi:hypothetical protein
MEMIKLKDLITEVKPGDVYQNRDGSIELVIQQFGPGKWKTIDFDLKPMIGNPRMVATGMSLEKMMTRPKKLSSSEKNLVKKILKNPEDRHYIKKDGLNPDVALRLVK